MDVKCFASGIPAWHDRFIRIDLSFHLPARDLGYWCVMKDPERHQRLDEAPEGFTQNQKDRAGVMVLPPLLILAALLLEFALRHFWTLGIGHRSFAITLGIVLCVLGLGCGGWGRMILLKAGTSVNPMKPTTAIASNGPYRFTRNPLYVGMMSVFLGLSLLVGTWWGFIIFCPVLAILHYGVVLREERYLERKFGPAYINYKTAVRRYL